jgi:hypothetical protein
MEVNTSRSYHNINTISYQNIRIKFHKRMDFFLTKGGSCSYDDETIGDIEVALR